MIYFKDLTSLDEEGKYNFIVWKKDELLADLIMSKPIEFSVIDLELWINNNSLDKNQFFKCVCRKSDSKVIGLARLMFIDRDSKVAEIGLYIGNVEDRNNKIGSEIIHLLTEFANRELQLNKIYAKINETNTGSIKLFLRLGFILEGILKKHYYSSIRKDFVDVFIYSKFM